jgi:hypothetical protein
MLLQEIVTELRTVQSIQIFCILKTATHILVTVFAGLVDTIDLRNAATFSTLYVHVNMG